MGSGVAPDPTTAVAHAAGEGEDVLPGDGTAAGIDPASRRRASSGFAGSGLADAGEASDAATSTFESASTADGARSTDGGARSNSAAHAADGVAKPSTGHSPHHAAGAHEAEGVATPHDDGEPRHSR